MNATQWVRMVPLLLILTGCDGGRQEVSSMSLDELSDKLGLTFPVGTELLAVSGQSGMDDALFAKIALSVDCWGAFLSHSSFSDTDFNEDKRYLLGKDDGWWDPERPASLPTAQAALPKGEFLNVGVDRSDPARLILYLMWHQT